MPLIAPRHGTNQQRNSDISVIEANQWLKVVPTIGKSQGPRHGCCLVGLLAYSTSLQVAPITTERWTNFCGLD